jgi:hypothetical protein
MSEPTHDKTLEDSFPASDPPANSGITGAEDPTKPSHKRHIEPTGTPNVGPSRHGNRPSLGGRTQKGGKGIT